MSNEVISTFFCSDHDQTKNLSENGICNDFLEIINDVNESISEFKLPAAVKCVYNPTIYARHTFEMYVRKYCNSTRKIMYFGMNPGPWGMSQTGVPFGEISSVRDWLKIQGPVNKPPDELRERPIKGFECTRTEVSGKRFWDLFKTICGDPDKFFESSFVYNYMNQQWMKSNGCNITPSDFKVSEMEHLYNICDPFFVQVIKLYEVKIVVAIGKFCETRALKAIKKYLPSSNIKVLYLSHPSPRSVNNNNWTPKAMEQLEKFGLLEYYT